VFLVRNRWQALQRRKVHHRWHRLLDLLDCGVWVEGVVEGDVFHRLRPSRSQNLWVFGVDLVAVSASVLERECSSVLSLSFCQVEEAVFLVEEEGAHGPLQEAEKALVYPLTHPFSGLGVVE
jgi:hypothetical protein